MPSSIEGRTKFTPNDYARSISGEPRKPQVQSYTIFEQVAPPKFKKAVNLVRQWWNISSI